MRTIFFVPIRKDVCPALRRKVEQIPYQWITMWSWWDVFASLAQPLVYKTQNSQGDSNADGRAAQGFTSEHDDQGRSTPLGKGSKYI